MKKFVDIIVLNGDNNILLLKRCDNCSYMPGKYCLPGGHVEEESTLLENACRELEEETGIKQNYLMKLENHTYEDGNCTTIFITFTDLFGDPFPQVFITHNEHKEYKWVKLDNLFIKNVIKPEEMMPELYDIIYKSIYRKDED